jgi:hypothetical protein
MVDDGKFVSKLFIIIIAFNFGWNDWLRSFYYKVKMMASLFILVYGKNWLQLLISILVKIIGYDHFILKLKWWRVCVFSFMEKIDYNYWFQFWLKLLVTIILF